MKIVALAAAAIVLSSPVFAGTTASSSAQTQASSAAANMGNNQAVTFTSAQPYQHTRVDTTPSLYAAPSAFGFSPSNCGGSDTAGVGWTGFVIGGSHAKEMFDCNVRQDVVVLWQLGLHEAAKLRMACFGSDLTRKAFEASGGVCPESATAKGIEGAPEGPKFQVAASLPETMHGTINSNGTVTWKH